jgi:hypothetical protein
MVKPVTLARRAKSSPDAPVHVFGRSLGDFGKLSPAEKTLLDCCRRGEDAVIAETRPEEQTEGNCVRAAFIRFLALGGDEHAPVHEHGVVLGGAWVTDVLDFNSARVEHELLLWRCRIEQLQACRATIKLLRLDGSYLTNGLMGQGLCCSSDVSMMDGFRASGEVNLAAATIAGVLDCSSARFENAEGLALAFYNARISGEVRLSKGCHAVGEVNFSGAAIGGDLDCRGGRFESGGEYALFFDRAELAGSVFLREDFHATGEVRLHGATIRGELDCGQARFENAGAAALSCERLKILGNIRLETGFHATGLVMFYGAAIGGRLSCQGGRFENEGKVALCCDMAAVSGRVELKDGFHAFGEVSFVGASIGGHFDCGGGRFENAKGTALNCSDATLLQSAVLTSGFHATGTTLFRGTRIGRDFESWRARFEDSGDETNPGLALSLARASVSGAVLLGSLMADGDFSSTGWVNLVGTTIGGNLQCRGDFDGEGSHALLAVRASVSGHVWLRDGFRAKGEVSLSGASISGDLDCQAGRFDGYPRHALSLENASVAGQVSLTYGFHATGDVRLDNASIGRALKCDRGSFESPHGQALFCGFAQVSGEFSFRNVQSLDGGIYLVSMQVGILSDDTESWAGARGWMELDGFTYDRLGDAPTAARDRVAWLDGQWSRHLGDQFRPQPWEQLIAVLRAMGHSNEARKVAIARQHRLRRARKVMLGARTLHWLYGVFVGYGYRPARLLSAVLAVWLVCGAAYWAAANPRWFGPAPLIAPTGPASGGIESFSPWVYSADVLLPIVDLGYSEAWMPVLTEPGGNRPSLWGLRLRGLRWLEIALGWLFGGALVAMLGSLVKRD